MRNPIRPKNFNRRFLPAALFGALLLIWANPHSVNLIVGSPLVFAGVGVRVWAAGHLVKTTHLTLSGPYAYLRHPLYLGTLLIGLGISLMLGGAASLVGVVGMSIWFGLAYLPRKERAETDRLADRYGAVYVQYRREVQALWPRWSRWTPEGAGEVGSEDWEERWQFSRFDTNNELGTVIAVVMVFALVIGRAALD